MKDIKILYHGSGEIVKNPLVLHKGYNKDFGYGFYLTEIKRQAEEWVIRKSRNTGGSNSKCL